MIFQQCLKLDADDRPTCSQLLRHELFTNDNFAQRFQQELKARIQKEQVDNPLLRSQKSHSSHSKEDAENKDNKKKKDKKAQDKKVGEKGDKAKKVCLIKFTFICNGLNNLLVTKCANLVLLVTQIRFNF